MSIEFIYLSIGLLVGLTIIIVILIFIKLFRADKLSNDLPKRFKYNFYLLREQYKDLLEKTRQEITKSQHASSFKLKMRFLKNAEKIIIKGLNFFPDNREGELLLMNIAKLKTENISKKCSNIRSSLDFKKQKLNLKKYQMFAAKTLNDIKKLQKLYPHNRLWKDFYSEVYLECIYAKASQELKEANRATLKHQYKKAKKHYSVALQVINTIPSQQGKIFNEAQRKTKKIIKRLNVKLNDSGIKKAA